MSASSPASSPSPSPSPSYDERYPIGPPILDPDPALRPSLLLSLRKLPSRFSSAYAELSPAKLQTPYRSGGWTLQQLAHHLADSHMHAFLRIKFAFTGDWPTILPYDEKKWAATAEVSGPVDAPLALLVPLHARMADLLESLDTAAWDRGYMHPESGRTSLAEVLPLYEWHGRHHTAHVLQLRQRMGW